MRLLLSAMIAALFSTSAAHAEQWRVTSLNTQSDGQIIMLVDQDSVKRTGKTVRANVMTVMELTSSLEDGGFTVSVIDREVDCSGKRSRMMRSRYFHEGTLLEDSNSPTEWRSIGAGSMVEGVADAMCGRGGYMTDKITDPENFGLQLFKLTPSI